MHFINYFSEVHLIKHHLCLSIGGIRQIKDYLASIALSVSPVLVLPVSYQRRLLLLHRSCSLPVCLFCTSPLPVHSNSFQLFSTVLPSPTSRASISRSSLFFNCFSYFSPSSPASPGFQTLLPLFCSCLPCSSPIRIGIYLPVRFGLGVVLRLLSSRPVAVSSSIRHRRSYHHQSNGDA